MYQNEQYYLARSFKLAQVMETLRPHFPLEPLSLKHESLYLRYQSATRVSSRSFLSLYAYAKEDEILIWENERLKYLCLLHLDRENRLCAYPPLGDYRPETYGEMVDAMLRMFQMAGEPFHMDNIEEHETVYLNALNGYRFQFTTTPDEDDYVCETASLTNFEGAENYNRRMNANKFRRRHEIRVVRVGPENRSDCEKVMDGWCETRDCLSCGFRCPRETALRAIHALDALGATGSLMYMDGAPEAMALLGKMSEDMADLLTIFSIHRYPGLTYCLLDETIRLCLPATKALNLEEDLGIPNLRRFKQSLHPAAMVRKYEARLVAWA